MNNPLLWKSKFPYDQLHEAGITPAANMSEIHKASLQLLGKGMNPQVRKALDVLRIIHRRLRADFYLYQAGGEIITSELVEKEILKAIEEVVAPDLEPSLTPDTSDLDRMQEAFEPLEAPEIPLDVKDPLQDDPQQLLDLIDFDS